MKFAVGILTAVILLWGSLAHSPGPEPARSPAAKEPRHEQEEFYFGDVYSKSPIAQAAFDLIEPTGGGWGRSFYLYVHSQLAPRMFNTRYKSNNKFGPEKMTKEGLLKKDRHALLRMAATSKAPMSPEEVEHYLKISQQTHVDQTLYANFMRDPLPGQSEREILAMLKLVRGHRFSEEYQAALLPWMHDFKELAKTVDRSKEKFIYEFARGANDGDPELFRFCFATMVKEAAADVLTRGGRLGEAYIYIHTVKEGTERHFTRNFPWKVWERPAPGHTILKLSVADAIDDKTFKPWEYFDLLHDQIRLLKPEKPSDAMTFMHDVDGKAEKTFELADASGETAARVNLRDYSRLTEARARLIAERFGIPWRKVEIATRLGPLHYRIYGRSPNEPPDERDRARIEIDSIRRHLKLEDIDFGRVLEHYRAEFRALERQAEAAGRSLQDLGLPEGYSEERLMAGLELDIATRIKPHRREDRDSKPWKSAVTLDAQRINRAARERETGLKRPLFKLRDAHKAPRFRWVW